jgi:hypothetical protein
MLVGRPYRLGTTPAGDAVTIGASPSPSPSLAPAPVPAG